MYNSDKCVMKIFITITHILSKQLLMKNKSIANGKFKFART